MATTKGNPYNWPCSGDLKPKNTALIVVDMQTDLCGKGGYVDVMRYDLSLTRAPIEPITSVLNVMRDKGYHIIHTREGHRPDLADPPANKRWRSQQIGSPLMSILPQGPGLPMPAPICCEPSWDIIEELYPETDEPIIDKPRKGSFCATDFELFLRALNIENIVPTGITTDVCVHTTMREANDCGFECLLLEDCCCATNKANHDTPIKMAKMQGGVFGTVSNSDTVVEQLP